MKILLLGATGKTGKLVIEEALKRGHDIVAIARVPGKLIGYNIKIIQGTPYEFEIVEKAISGCDAVINLLDVSRNSPNPWSRLISPKDLISHSAGNAIKAMEERGIKRFIALSTIGAGSSWKTAPLILRFIVSVSNMKYAFRDLGRQEELLEMSDLDYTICRAPKLTDEKKGVGYEATTRKIDPLTNRLNRVFAAAYCLELIETNHHLRETINLTNKFV
ncbi:NAD(P)H-binding protein [Mucilaginibacter sp. KACC 22773]|uniref:NAD(P)-dependent oxidoreductase n=1 Tax=Mucilaginibacter sp. KACC 22773 TaxID=3025671 RepID=UPI0023667FF0|nr:NAD(P)H-binding protein [Mucilaginibacter sp. KACC 22773]WDF77092.1 NAD(P)H-binding protein [Mucilaginibacter sp. KACC 22773]